MSDEPLTFDLNREANCDALSALLVGKQVYSVTFAGGETTITLHDCTLSIDGSEAVVRPHA